MDGYVLVSSCMRPYNAELEQPSRVDRSVWSKNREPLVVTWSSTWAFKGSADLVVTQVVHASSWLVEGLVG